MEAIYKVRLTEFVFKCNKGYTFSAFKDLFVQRKIRKKIRMLHSNIRITFNVLGY